MPDKSKDNWETDIALIKADIKTINKFFGRVENSIDLMTDLSKNVAVQHEVLKSTSEKLEAVEKLCDESIKNEASRLVVLNDRLEEYRRSARDDHQKLADYNAAKRLNSTKEILDKIDTMERSMHARVNDQNKKVTALENWKYYMMGVGAVLLLLMAKLNWPTLFS